jgi:hypothetical protein
MGVSPTRVDIVRTNCRTHKTARDEAKRVVELSKEGDLAALANVISVAVRSFDALKRRSSGPDRLAAPMHEQDLCTRTRKIIAAIEFAARAASEPRQFSCGRAQGFQ